MSQNDTSASAGERQAAIDRVRKAQSELAKAMGIFSKKPKTDEDAARVEAAKKELDAANAELVRIQGDSKIEAPNVGNIFGKAPK